MTSKPKSKQATMFDALAKKTGKRSSQGNLAPSVVEVAVDLKSGQKPQASELPEPTKQRRNRVKTGKRSDPSYTQVGCYLPRELNNRVKVKLVADPRDFSDLVAELLDNWLSK